MNRASEVPRGPNDLEVVPTLTELRSDGSMAHASKSESPLGRVLLVGEQRRSLDDLVQALRGATLLVSARTRATHPLDFFVPEAFDSVVVDVAHAGHSLDVLRSIREIDANVPVVLLTEAPMLQTAMDAITLGAFRYLPKPVQHTTLLDVVRRATRQCRRARAKERALRVVQGPSTSVLEPEAVLERAIGTLWPAFQPIVRASDGSVYGYEALMRSDDAILATPGTLVTAAERLDRLPLLGRAMRKASYSAFAGADDDLHLFLNVHPRELLDPDLADLQSLGSIAPNRVVLELTERASLDTVPGARQRIRALRELGFKVAVDDLGAGYAGLLTFASLEPELVKLDMGLIRDVDASSTRQRLVRSMTNLARELGHLVVAEGVETEAERQTLVDLGVDLLQGYLVGRPQRSLISRTNDPLAPFAIH